MSNRSNIVADQLDPNQEKVKNKRLTGKIKPTLAGLTAATLGLSGTFLIASPAFAAPGYSAAEAQYLSGSLLTIPLEDIAELEGERAESPFGNTQTVTQSGNLDLSLVGDTLFLQVADGVQIPVSVADAGVVGQYAQATPEGNSTAVSGVVTSEGVVDVAPDAANPPGPVTLDLSQLLGGEITGQIANLNLVVGANTAVAQQNGSGVPTGDYNIADLDAVITSPTLAGLSADVSASATPLEDSVNAIVGPDGSLVTSITGLVDAAAPVTSDVSVDVDLNPIVDDVLAQNQILGADGPVTVNLADGTIVVDVAALLAANGTDLNNLPANSEVLNTELAALVTAEVDGLVNGLLDEVNEAVDTALNAAVVNIDILVGTEENPLLSIEANGPLSDLQDGTLLSTIVLGEDTEIDLGLINGTVQAALGGVQALDLDTAALDTELTGLYPAVDSVLSDFVTLTANNQETVDGVFTETALRLGVLNFADANGEALELNLASASVGPNALVIDPANPDTIIVGFVPTEGPEAGGTEVTITGTGFTGATGVLFGTTPGTEVTVVSDTEITAVSPAGTGAVNLTVTGTQYGDAVSPGQFTYIPNSTTGAVTSFTPTEGPEAGGTEVTITGNGFTGATAVAFGNDAAASFTVDSDTQITAITAPGTGSVLINLTTPTGIVTSADEFTFVPAANTGSIDGVTPDEGPEAGGQNVTITGSGFTGATDVLFGDEEATNVVVVSDTVITATTPAGTGVVTLTVVGTTANGDIDSDVEYTYVDDDAVTTPVVDGFTPNNGPENGGTVIVITGENLGDVTNVFIGGNPATDVVATDTTVTATVPAGTGVVPVTIVTSTGDNVEAPGDFTYTTVADGTDDGGVVPVDGTNGNDGNNGNNDGGVISAGGTDTFANCDAARAAGQENIRQGDPGYSTTLDRDRDGIACESDGADDANNGGTDNNKLAYTGTEMVLPLGLLAGALLVVGGGLFIARRRV